MTDQQAPSGRLAALLHDLSFSGPEDYFRRPLGDRSYFLRRVRSTVERDVARVLETPRRERQLRMHFRVSREPGGGWHNMPNEVFARKLGFFSKRTIVSFPFDAVDPSEGGDLASLLGLLSAARPFLEAGMLDIVPSYDPLIAVSDEAMLSRYNIASANFKMVVLESEFEEHAPGSRVATLYLPYFRDMAPETVVRIRTEESALYDAFEERLGKLLHGLARPEEEKKLYDVLQKVDEQVRRLDRRYLDIQRALRKQKIQALIDYASVGMVISVSDKLAQEMNRVLGPDNRRILFREWKLHTGENRKEFSRDDFYLLWHLRHPQLNASTINLAPLR